MVVVVTQMSESQDHFASDQSTTTVVFRNDLCCTPNDGGRQTHVVIEDPVGGTFYRLGKNEYALASLMIPGRTIADAYRELCERFPDHRLSEDDAADLCRWLISNELAYTESSSSTPRMHASANQSDRERNKQRSNPVVIRVPLIEPDEWVTRLTRRLGWLFGLYATIFGIVIMLLAGGLAIQNWDELQRSAGYLFSGASVLQFVVITIALKVVHEFAHAIVCKRYGGDVGEMGVLFILFAPLAYVDVTSVWRFRNRWQRIHVAAAGIYLELVITSVAMMIWQFTDSEFVRHLCTRTMLTASVMTILFNANPLMKFDGYFILTDWARCPNLYSDSHQYLSRLSRRLFFGGQNREPDWQSGYRCAVACYGWLALIWKCFVCVGLIVAASKLFYGLGTLIALIAGWYWMGVPAWNAVKHFQKASWTQRRRCLAVSTLVTCVAGIVLAFVPWIGADAVPAVVEFSPHDIIRADAPGFVETIHVTAGQAVSAGDELVTLRNHELKLAAEDLERKIGQATIRQRQQTLKGQRAAAQVEATEIESLRNQHDEALRQVAALTIRAPRAGTVIRRGLDELIGTYVAQGDEILIVGNETQKELRLLIPHTEYERFSKRVGARVNYRTGVFSSDSSTLFKIIPRAKTAVDYPALLATNGGPLAVKTVSSDQTESDRKVELLVPHFEAVVPLDGRQGAVLRSGQRASVSLAGDRESIGSHLRRLIADWAM